MTTIKFSGVEIQTDAPGGAVARIVADSLGIIIGMPTQIAGAPGGQLPPPITQVDRPALPSPKPGKKIKRKYKRRAAAPEEEAAEAPTSEQSAPEDGKRYRGAYLCKEKSGQFSAEDAGKIADVTASGITLGIRIAMRKGEAWARVGGFHFRRAGEAKAASNGDGHESNNEMVNRATRAMSRLTRT